jgi:hypothetical protein
MDWAEYGMSSHNITNGHQAVELAMDTRACGHAIASQSFYEKY